MLPVTCAAPRGADDPFGCAAGVASEAGSASPAKIRAASTPAKVVTSAVRSAVRPARRAIDTFAQRPAIGIVVIQSQFGTQSPFGTQSQSVTQSQYRKSLATINHAGADHELVIGLLPAGEGHRSR